MLMTVETHHYNLVKRVHICHKCVSKDVAVSHFRVPAAGADATRKTA